MITGKIFVLPSKGKQAELRTHLYVFQWHDNTREQEVQEEDANRVE